MDYTTKLVLRLDKLSKRTNEAPICFRVTVGRAHTYKELVKIPPLNWDDQKHRIKNAHPQASELNLLLDKKVSHYKSLLAKNATIMEMTIHEARAILHQRSSLDVLEFGENYVIELHHHGNYATYKKFKSVLGKLSQYVGTASLPLQKITPAFIVGYEKHLLYELKNNRNTTTVNMKALKKLVGDMYIKYGLDESKNPFRGMTFAREQTKRIFLELEEINKIRECKLTPLNPLNDIRDIFMMECFTGCRISDILTLKWKHYTGKELDIRMRKTGKKITIFLCDEAKALIRRRAVIAKQCKKYNPEEYVFDYLGVDVEQVSKQDALNAISCATTKVNKGLKKLATYAKLDKEKRMCLSTHVGRHSHVTLLLTEGADLYAVSQLVGHRDTRTTQIYANLVDKKRQQTINLLNKVL